MSKYTKEIEKRRTFAIISHPDAGKTTSVSYTHLGKKIQNLIWLRGRILRKHWSMSAAIPCMLMKMRFARGF